MGELAAPLVYAVAGGGLAGAVVLLDALVADTIDYDKLRTGLVLRCMPLTEERHRRIQTLLRRRRQGSRRRNR